MSCLLQGASAAPSGPPPAVFARTAGFVASSAKTSSVSVSRFSPWSPKGAPAPGESPGNAAPVAATSGEAGKPLVTITAPPSSDGPRPRQNRSGGASGEACTIVSRGVTTGGPASTSMPRSSVSEPASKGRVGSAPASPPREPEPEHPPPPPTPRHDAARPAATHRSRRPMTREG